MGRTLHMGEQRTRIVLMLLMLLMVVMVMSDRG